MINFLYPEWICALVAIIGVATIIISEIYEKNKNKHRYINYAILATVITTSIILGMGYDITHPSYKGKTTTYNQGTHITPEWYEKEIINQTPKIIHEDIERIIIKKELKNLVGIYLPYRNTIIIKPETTTTEMKKTFTHETAHKYWKTKLNKTQKEEWETLHKKTTTWPEYEEYRKTDSEEDFCEETSDIIVYRTIITDWKKLMFLKQNYLEPQGMNATITNHNGWYEVQI